MLKGINKKFIIFILIALGMIAVIGMTPENQKKKMLKPIIKLYDKDESMDEKTSSTEPKVVVESEDAELQGVHVEPDLVNSEVLIPISEEDANNLVLDKEIEGKEAKNVAKLPTDVDLDLDTE